MTRHPFPSGCPRRLASIGAFHPVPIGADAPVDASFSACHASSGSSLDVAGPTSLSGVLKQERPDINSSTGTVSHATPTVPASAFSFTYDHHVAMRRLATSTTRSTIKLSDAATNISKIMNALLVDAGATMRAALRCVIGFGNLNNPATGVCVC